MLEPQDIQKLMEVLATKDDIKRIIKDELVDTNATLLQVKKDVVDISKKVVTLEMNSVMVGQRLNSIDDHLTVLEEKQDRVIDILDKMVGRLEALHQEYLVLKERDTRYERWFKEIAEKVGITLVP